MYVCMYVTLALLREYEKYNRADINSQ
jgi:hypothetical protein